MVKQHNIILDVFILYSYTNRNYKRVFTEFDWSTEDLFTNDCWVFDDEERLILDELIYG